MALTKSELIENLAKIESTRKKAGEILETLLEIIKKKLENGEDVLISGFGKFSVREKRKRRGRNPATGNDLILSERRVVTFNCSPVLRDKIN
ncbi:MAG: integration host factor subunit alpha [Deltaproteobacteria bacterium]|nr:integration host factor subunit alpha [Deltaproteobacteria bacterium]